MTRMIRALLHRIFNNPPVALPVDIRSIRSVLVFRYDRIGDMVVTFPMIRWLKKQNPALQVGVLCSPANAAIARTESSIDKVHILRPGFAGHIRSLRELRLDPYDLILQPVFHRAVYSGFLGHVASPKGIKIGDYYEKYSFYYNAMIVLDRHSTHMINVLASIVEQVFGTKWPVKERKLVLPVNEGSRNNVESFLKECGLAGKRFVLVNLSVGEDLRKVSPAQYRALLSRLTNFHRLPCVMLHMPAERVLAEQFQSEFSAVILFPKSEGQADLNDVIALAEASPLVVTPDTSIVHFAAAFGCPVVSIYAAIKLDPEWNPYRIPHRLVVSKEGKWVDTIDPAEITGAVDSMLEELGWTKPKRAVRSKKR